MSSDPSSEETTVFAIYSTRRDAELARDYLQDANIETFVRTDDAGGMYPQLQRPHGVKLVGLRPDAQDAYEALNAADLLPEPVEETEQEDSSGASPEPEDLTMSPSGMAGVLGLAAVVLIVLYYVFVG